MTFMLFHSASAYRSVFLADYCSKVSLYFGGFVARAESASSLNGPGAVKSPSTVRNFSVVHRPEQVG